MKMEKLPLKTDLRHLALLVLSFTVSCGSGLVGTDKVSEKNLKVPSSETLVTNETAGEQAPVNNEFEPLNLTQEECPTVQTNKVTVSPRGELYINAPQVLADQRALNVDASGKAGKWSFAYALREILELAPNPGTDAALLALEQAAVDSFIARFGNTIVNTKSSGDRSSTRSVLTSSWGRKIASNGTQFRWLGGAPFKLVAIVNRMDLVKKKSDGSVDATTAGEGRLVYGFSGGSPMTVIFEYNLPRADLSPIPFFQANWTNEWHKLKNFLVDTNATIAGVQPNSSLTTQPSIENTAGYLSQLEFLTERFVARTAQKRSTSATETLTQAAISQIRTNEFIMGPWQLREIIRARNTSGSPVLTNTTTKNVFFPTQNLAGTTPSTEVSIRNNSDLGNWADANVTCSNLTNIATCRFSSRNEMIPSSVNIAGVTFRVGPISNEDGAAWFPGSTVIKRRFMALQSCDGCHQSETGVFFTHTSPSTGNPSTFLTNATNVGNSGFLISADLERRANNMKNLVCLAATTTSSLNLTSQDDTSLLHRNPEWYSVGVH